MFIYLVHSSTGRQYSTRDRAKQVQVLRYKKECKYIPTTRTYSVYEVLID